jgi:hypothetical protein
VGCASEGKRRGANPVVKEPAFAWFVGDVVAAGGAVVMSGAAADVNCASCFS